MIKDYQQEIIDRCQKLHGGRFMFMMDEVFVRGDSFRTRCGLLLNHRAWWVGAHWSSYNRRLCVNLLPCVTFWLVLKGGRVPRKGNL